MDDETSNAKIFPYKIELHVHMDGAPRHQTILELGKLYGWFPQTDTLSTLREKIVLNFNSSLTQLIFAFETFMPAFSGHRDAVYRMAYEFCEDSAKQGIKYTEARFSPHILANTFEKPVYATESGSYSPRDVVTTILKAFDCGQKDFGIKVKAILCCIRNHPEWSLEVGQLCREFKGDVVAIDIAGPEYLSGKDPSACSHKLAFNDVEKAGMHRTAHACEIGTPEMMYEALDEYHTERIGHGYRSLECKDMYARVLRERIHLETCPISSLKTSESRIGLENHPILRFAKDNANFSISTDDPTVLDNTLSDDYSMARKLGLTNKDITQAIFNAANSSFASKQEKQSLLSDLVKVYGIQE